MMRIFLLILTALLIQACASSSDKPSSSSESEQKTEAATTGEEKSKSEPEEEKYKVDPKDQVSKDVDEVDPKYSQLVRAIKSNSLESVKREAQNILGSNPKDGLAMNALGTYHMQKGAWVAAQYFYDLALKMNPKFVGVLNNKALIELQEGNLSAGLTLLKQAYRIDSDNFYVCLNLGSVYVFYSDFLKALPLLENAYKKRKTSVKAAANYAVALRGAGKLKEAKDIIVSALSKNNKSANLLLNYAILLIEELGEYQEGLTVINRLELLGVASNDQKKKIIELKRVAQKKEKK